MHAQRIQERIDMLSGICREIDSDQEAEFITYLLSMAILELYALMEAEYSDNDNRPIEK